ncbi:uncharacterized protein B0H18DRAFT_66087 [Fomitopsis serialis]|uniref:uncharacterized protein n=1 Tax=Fomitopsis serialis TaxID=139415 RepID=UPI0020075A4B|nr:uncharacterized protein B0H18DRAFT_66087 [Neoantrodia serialis]KAH9916487.1 hypothetical protein B0H18DRAFT_66087 [Neoantrodia serialis]
MRAASTSTAHVRARPVVLTHDRASVPLRSRRERSGPSRDDAAVVYGLRGVDIISDLQGGIEPRANSPAPANTGAADDGDRRADSRRLADTARRRTACSPVATRAPICKTGGLCFMYLAWPGARQRRDSSSRVAVAFPGDVRGSERAWRRAWHGWQPRRLPQTDAWTRSGCSRAHRWASLRPQLSPLHLAHPRPLSLRRQAAAVPERCSDSDRAPCPRKRGGDAPGVSLRTTSVPQTQTDGCHGLDPDTTRWSHLRVDRTWDANVPELPSRRCGAGKASSLL